MKNIEKPLSEQLDLDLTSLKSASKGNQYDIPAAVITEFLRSQNGGELNSKYTNSNAVKEWLALHPKDGFSDDEDWDEAN